MSPCAPVRSYIKPTGPHRFTHHLRVVRSENLWHETPFEISNQTRLAGLFSVALVVVRPSSSSQYREDNLAVRPAVSGLAAL